jgi:hypothetical protein
MSTRRSSGGCSTAISRKVDAGPEFEADYARLGAQRNAKIVGIFARLWLRDGKPRYLPMIPRVWAAMERDPRASRRWRRWPSGSPSTFRNICAIAAAARSDEAARFRFRDGHGRRARQADAPADRALPKPMVRVAASR